MKKVNVSVRLDKILVDSLDQQIDGVKFSSRTHAFAVLLTEYLERYSAETKGKQTSLLPIRPPKKA